MFCFFFCRHMKPCIGDIMTKAAPFLKMYSLYVQHFDEAMKLIKLWSERSNGFDLLIKNIQKLPECNFLTLQVITTRSPTESSIYELLMTL